jgi:uncharacterized protein
MYVVAARIALRLAHAHSLKEKRAVVRRIKARVEERLTIRISEVGALDMWQRAELGGAVVSVERAKAMEVVDAVIRMISDDHDVELLAQRREVMRVDAGSDQIDEPSMTVSQGTGFEPPSNWLEPEESA